MQPYRFVVRSPILHPVPARVGDIVVARPGHAERPIVVMRLLDGRWQPVRIGPANFGALLVQESDGAISPLLSDAPALADHPLCQSA